MKKWLCCLLVALVLIVPCATSGCAFESSVEIGCIATQTERSFQMEYALFSGRKVYRKTLTAGDAVRVEITTNSGELRLTLQGDSADTPIYVGTISEFSAFTINVDEGGAYTFTVVATSHSGSFSVSW